MNCAWLRIDYAGTVHGGMWTVQELCKAARTVHGCMNCAWLRELCMAAWTVHGYMDCARVSTRVSMYE